LPANVAIRGGAVTGTRVKRNGGEWQCERRMFEMLAAARREMRKQAFRAIRAFLAA